MNNFSDLLNINLDLLILLLYLPIITTLIGIARYLIGVKTLSIYAPIVITLMFFELGFDSKTNLTNPVDGLKYGIPLLIIIVLSTVFSYRIIKNWAMHYYSKLAIVITIEVMIIILVLLLADFLGKPGILSFNIFVLIIITSLSEKFLNLIAFNKSAKTGILLSIETIVVAAVCYLLISIPFFQNFLFDYPISILVLFPVNFLVGKFTGLRLTEYHRFKEVLTQE